MACLKAQKSQTYACVPASYLTTPEPQCCPQGRRWSIGPQRWSYQGRRRDPRLQSEQSLSIPSSSGQSGTSPCSDTSRYTQKTWNKEVKDVFGWDCAEDKRHREWCINTNSEKKDKIDIAWLTVLSCEKKQVSPPSINLKANLEISEIVVPLMSTRVRLHSWVILHRLPGSNDRFFRTNRVYSLLQTHFWCLWIVFPLIRTLQRLI